MSELANKRQLTLTVPLNLRVDDLYGCFYKSFFSRGRVSVFFRVKKMCPGLWGKKKKGLQIWEHFLELSDMFFHHCISMRRSFPRKYESGTTSKSTLKVIEHVGCTASESYQPEYRITILSMIVIIFLLSCSKETPPSGGFPIYYVL